jgi:hypothetical protein
MQAAAEKRQVPQQRACAGRAGALLTVVLLFLIMVLVVEPLVKAHGSLQPPPAALRLSGAAAAHAALPHAPPPSAPDGIVGVYVVYRRPKAMLQAALSFRTAYPDAPLYIVCDSGCYDYRRLAAGLGARFLGPLRLTIKNGRMFMSTDECMALFDVWRRVLAETSEPYFMHLEDDVRVIQRVKSALPWDINGAVDFAVMHPPVEAWIKARNPQPAGERLYGKLPLGGMGGNIFRSAYWRERLASPTLAEETDSLIRVTDTKNIDAIVSALTYLWNGTVGFFDGYGGGWSPKMGEVMYNGRLEVEHDYKVFYNLNLTENDLQALGPGWDVPLEAPPPPPKA